MKQNITPYDALNAALQAHPEGISIQEVAELTGVHRNTAAKYLEVLQSQGEVDVRRVGVSKLFIASRRVPFTCILRLYDDPVIGIDRDLLVIDLNEPAAHLIGANQKTVIGTPIWSLEYLLGTGTPEKVREIMKGKWDNWDNGLKNQPLLIKGIPVKFSDSRTGAALLVVDQNMVLGVRAELDRCTEILRMITDYQTEYFFRLTLDLNYKWVNPAYARLFNISPEQMIGSRLSLRVPEDERNHILESIRESKSEGTIIEHRIHLPHGDIRYHQITCFKDSKKTGEGEFICVGRDITELKFKEEQFKRFYEGSEEILAERTHELRELNRQLYCEIANREQVEATLRTVEFVVQHVADLIIWFDVSGKIIYTNQTTRTVLKLDEADQIGTIRNIISIPPNDCWNSFWDLLRKNQKIFYETLFSTIDSQTIPVEALFNHLVNGDDEYCCCIARDIHERKLALSELIESENRFRQLAGTIPEVFYLRDIRTGSFLYINQAYEHIFGLPLSQIYQDPSSWTESIHPDDHDMVLLDLEGCENSSRETEFRIIRPDGSIRWLDLKVFVVYDTHDKPYRNVGVVFDITVRKTMEEELRLSNDRLMTTIRAAPVSIFNQDKDLRYTWIGQSSLGYTPSDVIGKTDDDLFLPDVAKKLSEIKKKALLNGKGGVIDVEIVHGDRQWTVRMYIDPFRDSKGEIAGITVASIDLTDIFLVKEALRSSEEKYRRLFDETNDICTVFSIYRDELGNPVDFEYIDLNQHALTLMGRKKREIIGRFISDFRPDIDPQWLAALRNVAEGGKAERFEGYSNFYQRYVSVNAYPMGDKLIGVQARDISELVRAYDLVEYQRDLGLALAATDDLEEALHFILEAGKKVPGIDSGGIYFRDEVENCLHLISYTGLNSVFIDKVRKIPLTLAMEELFSRGELVFYQTDGKKAIPPSLDIVIEEGLKTYVVLPILHKGSLYAFLNLSSHTLDEIPEIDHPYLEALAAHLGETLARLRREPKSVNSIIGLEFTTSFQILDPDGKIIEGSAPYMKDGYTMPEVLTIIQENRSDLLSGQEVTKEVKLDTVCYALKVRLRFIPWDREVAYLAIWERSGSTCNF